MWFFQGTTFQDWMLIGSLLWIYGKRKLVLLFAPRYLMVSDLHSWIREEHPLVRHFLTMSRSQLKLMMTKAPPS